VTLAEDLFLLASHETSGRARISTAYLDLGLGGALLLDLVLRQRVALVDDHVAVVDRAAVGDPLLDAALNNIAGSGRRARGVSASEPRSREREIDTGHEPEYWVRHLHKGVRAAAETRLVEAGVLRADDDHVLGFLPVHHTHQVDGRIELELLHRLHDAVVDGRPPSPETAALVSLALAVGLDRHLFPRSDRRAIRRRMQEIAEGEWVGDAVKHAIDAVNAALGIAIGPEP
jgi:hypothetical protein